MFGKRLKTKSPESEVLAFAPVYKEIDYPVGDLSSMRQAIDASDFLLPLHGIIKEVQSIKETVPSRVFINEKATEANFKKYASDYNILSFKRLGWRSVEKTAPLCKNRTSLPRLGQPVKKSGFPHIRSSNDGHNISHT